MLFVFGLLGPLVQKIGNLLLPLWRLFVLKWIKEHFHLMFVVAMAILYVYELVSEVISLGNTRRLLNNPGTVDQDNQWGYGQTTAVLIWAPILRPAQTELIKAGKGSHPTFYVIRGPFALALDVFTRFPLLKWLHKRMLAFELIFTSR